MLKSFQLWIARTLARSRSKPPKLSRAQLHDLSRETKIPESELRSLYKRFMKACPQYHPNAREAAPAPDHANLDFGQRLRMRTTRIKLPLPRLDRAALRLLYSKFFPFGDPRAFADRVFDVLDADRDGLVGFVEYATALSVASRPDDAAARERLLFAFCLCDSDRDGFITRDDIMNLAQALDDLVGPLAATVNPHMAPRDDDASSEHHSEQLPSPSPWGTSALSQSAPEGCSALSHATCPTSTHTPANVGCISTRPLSWTPHVHMPPPLAGARVAPPSSAVLHPNHYASTDGLLFEGRPSLNRGFSFTAPADWPCELASRVDHLFSLLDVNHDGKVPFNEFVQAVQNNAHVSRAMNLFAGLVASPSQDLA